MYEVIQVNAPVYEDHDRTTKKGKAVIGTTFESVRWEDDNDGNAMVKTNSIEYFKQEGDIIPLKGDGWLVGTQVRKIQVDDTAGPQPGDVVGDAELGSAVRRLIAAFWAGGQA